MRIFHKIVFLIQLFLVLGLYYYVDTVYNAVVRMSTSIATAAVGQPGITNPTAVVLHPVVKIGASFMVALIITTILHWIIRLMLRNAGNIGKTLASNALAIIVILASPAMALFEAQIFWGVTIWGYELIPRWDPVRILPWMTFMIAMVPLAYVVLQLLPIALAPFIGFAMAVANIISCIAPIAAWGFALLTYVFSSDVYWTPFMTYALMAFGLRSAFDLLLIFLILRVRVRGYIATGSGEEEAALHGGRGPT